MAPPTLEATADRLAALLTSGGGGLGDHGHSRLDFVDRVAPRPLAKGAVPGDVWAVDGGQALVADARCLQVLATRASRVRFREGSCTIEEEGPLRVHLLGGRESRRALDDLGVELPPETAVDVNLLRDCGEWEAVARCVEEADDAALVLVDGDLQPDWRLPASVVSAVLEQAGERGIVVAGITKHSSLSRGGAPLVGQVEAEADDSLGPRARWWTPVARTRGDGAALQVVAAKLDPSARFAFRVDLAAGVDAPRALGAISSVSDDGAFPGYPYPLSVADRLAACPPWLREEIRLELDEALARAGVGPDVLERAFTDRHRLMERM